METGSSTTLAVTPARQRSHRSAVKAHGRVASNGTLQSGSYGISSVSRTGLGTYEVTLSVTMANTNYTVIAIGGLSEGGTVTILTNTSTTVITVQTRSSGNNALDDRSFAIMVLGDLA